MVVGGCDISFTTPFRKMKRKERREKGIEFEIRKNVDFCYFFKIEFVQVLFSLSVYYYPLSAGYHKYTFFLTAPSI